MSVKVGVCACIVLAPFERGGYRISLLGIFKIYVPYVQDIIRVVKLYILCFVYNMTSSRYNDGDKPACTLHSKLTTTALQCQKNKHNKLRARSHLDVLTRQRGGKDGCKKSI